MRSVRRAASVFAVLFALGACGDDSTPGGECGAGVSGERDLILNRVEAAGPYTYRTATDDLDPLPGCKAEITGLQANPANYLPEGSIVNFINSVVVPLPPGQPMSDEDLTKYFDGDLSLPKFEKYIGAIVEYSPNNLPATPSSYIVVKLSYEEV